MKTPLYNLDNKAVGEIELPDAVFARPWNPDLVAQAIHVQDMNRRQPLAHTKGRGEVSGGGRKPWRQKGTGRARQGSIRSPIWKGGGVAHGPTNEKIFARRIPKGMLRGAIHSALSKKLADHELRVIDTFVLTRPKTKELSRSLTPFRPSALIVPERGNTGIYRASRNIPSIKALDAGSLNVRDIMKYRHILIAQKALETIR